MKKIFAILLATALLLGLCACRAEPTATEPTVVEVIAVPSTEPTTTEAPATEPTTLALPVLSETNKLEQYIADVNKRLESLDYKEGKYLYWKHTDAEHYWADVYNIDLFRYGPYSILYKDAEEGVKLFSITEYGMVYTQFQSIGNVHFPSENEHEEIIHSTANYAVVMDLTNNSVSCWSFRKKLCEHDLPHEAVYVGFSDWVGYLFRAGTDVYTLYDIGICNFSRDVQDCHFKLIARNVRLVIDADYYATSAACSQPLFHMTDGSVKMYCSWVENPDDLDSCLHEVPYEGGYDK